eukprot:8885676-Alexandrium_andersonii.AAC.1
MTSVCCLLVPARQRQVGLLDWLPRHTTSRAARCVQRSWGCCIRNPARGQGNAIAPLGLGSRGDCVVPTEH